MFLPLFFLASFFILSTTAETDCAGYSIDKCALPDDSIIETLKDVGEDDCQFYCNVIYSPDCTFYIYDKQQVLCQLLNSPMNGYVSSCSKYAGPPTPSVAKCLSSTDACKVFRYYNFKSDITIYYKASPVTPIFTKTFSNATYFQ